MRRLYSKFACELLYEFTNRSSLKFSEIPCLPCHQEITNATIGQINQSNS